jgi:stage III sporulation protein AH
MNKKQAIIIVALVVLIACAGVLASMANNPLYVDVKNGANSAISFNNSSTKGSTTDFYAATKLNRDNQSAQTMQNLKSIMDDTNVPQQSKTDAAKKFTDVTDASNKEMRIEAVLKTKGFDDAICFVEDNKVRIIVKSKDPQLTDKQTKLIKSVVLDETKINNMEISVK